MKFIKNVKKKLNFLYQKKKKNNEKIKLQIYIVNNFNVSYIYVNIKKLKNIIKYKKIL